MEEEGAEGEVNLGITSVVIGREELLKPLHSIGLGALDQLHSVGDSQRHVYKTTPHNNSIHNTPQYNTIHNTPQYNTIHNTPQYNTIHNAPQYNTIHNTPQYTTIHNARALHSRSTEE